MDEEHTISMSSGCNPQGKPFVHYNWGDKKCQFSPEEARQHGLALIEVAEAAAHDAAVFNFLRQRLGLEPEQAAGMIGDLRNYRAGVGGGAVEPGQRRINPKDLE